jgi:hypothetical protein
MKYICPIKKKIIIIKDKVLITVSCPIFSSILIAKNLLTGSLKNRSIDNLETQKKSISMKGNAYINNFQYKMDRMECTHISNNKSGEIIFPQE